MKKSLSFTLSLLFSLLCTQTFSQDTATNKTNEAWRINYYGATYMIPADTGPVMISPGTDCSAGISVWNLACTTPEFFTMSSDSYDTTGCSTETDEVTFTGDLVSPPPSCPGYASDIFENIEIIFVP